MKNDFYIKDYMKEYGVFVLFHQNYYMGGDKSFSQEVFISPYKKVVERKLKSILEK